MKSVAPSIQLQRAFFPCIESVAGKMSAERKVKIGVIGGSGLNKPEIISDREERYVDTPFGRPSDALICGTIGGVDCILLCRHGRSHTIFPTAVNYRANIWALREAGCTHIIATTACGSLKEVVAPGHLVFLDQFIDRTTKRASTFYDGDLTSPLGVCHIPMHKPFCAHTLKILIESAEALSIAHHPKGTNITVEGPRFSTRAESLLFRSWGADIINMTTVPEVVLANELGIPYVAIALVTDYDCWKENETRVSDSSLVGTSVYVTSSFVSKDKVMATMATNAVTVTKLLLDAIPKIAATDFTAILKEYKEVADSSIMLPH